MAALAPITQGKANGAFCLSIPIHHGGKRGLSEVRRHIGGGAYIRDESLVRGAVEDDRPMNASIVEEVERGFHGCKARWIHVGGVLPNPLPLRQAHICQCVVHCHSQKVQAGNNDGLSDRHLKGHVSTSMSADLLSIEEHLGSVVDTAKPEHE